MITGKEMITMLQRDLSVLEQQVDGLTHDDSVLQLPFQGNCLNWVVGHMIVHRDKILAGLGANPLWGADRAVLYDHGSEPITDGTTAVNFEKMMADLRTSQARLATTLAATTEAQFDAAAEGRDGTVRDWVVFLVWHDAYHTGQTEYLRQLTGVGDKVI